jgi:hypothetical protein
VSISAATRQRDFQSITFNTAMPLHDYTGFWKVAYDWQALIAGVAALIGGLVAYVAVAFKRVQRARRLTDS